MFPTTMRASSCGPYAATGKPVFRCVLRTAYTTIGADTSRRADVAGLDMHITSTELVYKHGACVKLFDSVQVMASGVVNACACRDVDATLRIGDARTGRLADILSTRNAEYMRIIEEQQQGRFQPVCAGCDFYKSIYHQRSEYRRSRQPMQTLEQFKEKLGQLHQPR